MMDERTICALVRLKDLADRGMISMDMYRNVWESAMSYEFYAPMKSEWPKYEEARAAYQQKRYEFYRSAYQAPEAEECRAPEDVARKMADKYLRDDAGEYDGMTRTERLKLASKEAQRIAPGSTGSAVSRQWRDRYAKAMREEIEKILRERKPKTPSFWKCTAEIALRSWALALSVAAPLALLAADVLLILPTGQPLKVGLAAFVSVITFSIGYVTAPDQYHKIRDRIREMQREFEAWREWKEKYGYH